MNRYNKKLPFFISVCVATRLISAHAPRGQRVKQLLTTCRQLSHSVPDSQGYWSLVLRLAAGLLHDATPTDYAGVHVSFYVHMSFYIKLCACGILCARVILYKIMCMWHSMCIAYS